jgi:hypothetical protein
MELGIKVGLLLDGSTVVVEASKLGALDGNDEKAIVDASDGDIDGWSVNNKLGIMVGL